MLSNDLTLKWFTSSSDSQIHFIKRCDFNSYISAVNTTHTICTFKCNNSVTNHNDNVVSQETTFFIQYKYTLKKAPFQIQLKTPQKIHQTHTQVNHII